MGGGGLLVAGFQHAQAFEPLRDGVDAGGLALSPNASDGGEPLVGLGRRPQGLVDHPPPRPAAHGLGGAFAEQGPWLDLGADQFDAMQQAFHGALRMIVLDGVPGVVGEVEVQARQDHRAARGGGDGAQKVGRGGGVPLHAGGHQHLDGRALPPTLRQRPQDSDAALGHVHQPQGAQAQGPVAQRQSQELGGDLPVAGQLLGRQGLEGARGDLRLLDLHGVEEAGQGVGQLQGGGGVQVALEDMLVGHHDPRQLAATPQGRDGGGEVQADVARLEGRLARVEVAQGADLRQEGGLPVGGVHKGFGQSAGRAAGGREHHGLGEPLRP